MGRIKGILVLALSVALLTAAPALAGQGKGQGRGQAAGTRQHGQWVKNQPPGWNGQGQKQGWSKHDSAMPVGLNKHFNDTGKYPQGLQKPR